MKRKPAFIYFDVGSVIVSNEAAMQSVARAYTVAYQDIYDLLNDNWKAGCTGKLSNRDYMGQFTKRLGISHPSSDIAEFWTEHQQPILTTHRLIRDLAGAYRLGILSNAERGILGKLIKKQKIPNVSWEVIVESARHGVIKPDEKIYRIAEEMAGVQPAELFFIDDREENVVAAEKRGWRGIVFDADNPDQAVEKIRRKLLR